MRVLLLFRGSPGCGKSTFIEQYGLEPYTLSADKLRLMYGSPVLDENGNEGINQALSGKAWDTLFMILEERMKNGEFTVIDAVNSKTKEMNQYKELCERYRYRCYIVDMTDIPVEEVKRRNRERIGWKVVPENVIDNVYARFKTQQIPGRIKVIKPEEIDTIYGKVPDFTETYKKIHVIGDLHGCYTAFREYMKTYNNDMLPEDEMFIFVGDYLDRGIENAEMFAYLSTISDMKNVVFLEGNHEHHLNDWAHGVPSVSKEFELRTRSQLERGGIEKSAVRMFYRKLWQMAHFTYGCKEYLITHGGLSCMPENMTYVSTKEMVHGSGIYRNSDNVDKSFMNNTDGSMIQIHGHRNFNNAPIQVNERCYNLEGKVEFGGCLRALEIYPDGKIITQEVQNTVFAEPEEVTEDTATENTQISVGDMVMQMRNNKFIKETIEGNISSFNFTKEAFQKGTWDNQTMKARGLFIDVPNEKIIARSYDKFFNIGEREETSLTWLSSKLQFPVKLYRKENGFLGIVSYDPYTDDLFIASKSRSTGEHAGYLRSIIEKTMNDKQRDVIKGYAKENNVTFVFECIDPINDPHIIKYPEQKVVLLDVVYNEPTFREFTYEEVCMVAKLLDIECKVEAKVLNNWQEFMHFYNECHQNDYKFNGECIEGFVVEDATGFKTKMKLNYYTFWKFLRVVTQIVLRQGYMRDTQKLTTPIMNMFYGWLKKCREDKVELPNSIIALREMFLQSEEGKQFADNPCDYD